MHDPIKNTCSLAPPLISRPPKAEKVQRIYVMLNNIIITRGDPVFVEQVERRPGVLVACSPKTKNRLPRFLVLTQTEGRSIYITVDDVNLSDAYKGDEDGNRVPATLEDFQRLPLLEPH